MTCREASDRLVDLLYAELDDHERAAMAEHLEGCAQCRVASKELRGLSAVLDRWTAPAPKGITERVLATLAIGEAEALRAQAPIVGLQHLGAFLVAGAGASALSLLLTAGTSVDHSPLDVGLLGALWTALYCAAGLLTRFGRWRAVVVSAVTAVALSIVLASALSMPVVIEACRRWLEAAHASVALNAAVVLAGALYGSVPVFLSSAIVSGGSRRIASGAIRLAAMYALLLAPSVYLQCHPLTLSLTVPWVAGVLLGSWLGSVGGMAVAVRWRLAPV